MEPARVLERVRETVGFGVDFVKIGLYPAGDPAGCLDALSPVARQGARLVAVFFADLWGEFTMLPAVARAGFAGAMLDTAGKHGGGLLRHKGDAAITRFVEEARALGLLTGLASSLTAADIPALLPLRPDYLGSRGALCAGGDRGGALAPAALATVRSAIPGVSAGG